LKVSRAANEQIEVYAGGLPFPSALFAGTIQGRVTHVVAALDVRGRMLHVISAYEPDAEHFEADGRTRKDKSAGQVERIVQQARKRNTELEVVALAG
jgi:hypothetical protein